MPFRSASTISPVISTLSSFCAMSSSSHSFGRTAEGREPTGPRPAHGLADDAHVGGLGALVTLLGLVLHLRALVQAAVARALDGAEVDEQVLTAFIGGDEAVPLVGVEPLDSSGCHISHSPP